MAIRRCPRLHYFDDRKYKTCPFCQSGAHPDIMEDDETVACNMVVDETIACNTVIDAMTEKIIVEPCLENDATEKRTVGWVVCVKGRNCGKDWHLHEGRNDIGTTADDEVQLAGSELGKGRACSIVYDGKHEAFLAVPGETALAYLNGELLSGPAALDDGDMICVGDYELCFQSFCGRYRE